MEVPPLPRSLRTLESRLTERHTAAFAGLEDRMSRKLAALDGAHVNLSTRLEDLQAQLVRRLNDMQAASTALSTRLTELQSRVDREGTRGGGQHAEKGNTDMEGAPTPSVRPWRTAAPAAITKQNGGLAAGDEGSTWWARTKSNCQMAGRAEEESMIQLGESVWDASLLISSSAEGFRLGRASSAFSLLCGACVRACARARTGQAPLSYTHARNPTRPFARIHAGSCACTRARKQGARCQCACAAPFCCEPPLLPPRCIAQCQVMATCGRAS